jgi:phosphate transport system substrate-binding protein
MPLKLFSQLRKKIMKSRQKLVAAVITLGLSLSLTACDPPMPEDIKIALAEKTILCESGLVELQLPEAVTDLGFVWADAMSVGCTDMQLSVTDSLTESTGLVVNPVGTELQDKAFLKVPFALDAAVLVVNIPDVFEIYLSAPTIQKIFSGEITSWNDPQVLEDNAGLDLPDMKIVLPTQALPAAKNSLAAWIERLSGQPLDLSKITDAKVSETELAMPEKSGAISIASYSAAVFSGSTFATILTEAGVMESGVTASTETIYSASTQLVAESIEDSINLTLDDSLTPTAPEGSAEAAAPYQAIFTIELSFIGEESKLARTAGRFLLRQESKGVIASSTMLPIPESVRILAVKIIESKLDVPPVE